MTRSRRRGPEAAAGRRDSGTGGAGRRTVWIALSLAGVLALQILFCGGSFSTPFLDTRLHYDYDNADFSFRARCGNRDATLRSQFGVTENSYSRWGVKSGESRYYTDHPFLVKAAFQQFTRIVGTEEWASRVFSLAVSFGIAAGLYVVLLVTTGSLVAAAAGSAILVSIPLFAVYQTCLKFETDGMLAGVWLFAALASYLRSGKASRLAAYGILVVLAFLVHWTSALFAGAIGVYLLAAWLRRRDPAAGRALAVTAAAAIAGIALLAIAMSYLQGSWRSAWEHLARSFAVRSAAIPVAAWWARQRGYFDANFTAAVAGVDLLIAVFLGAGRLRRSGKEMEPIASAERLLPVFFFSTLAVAVMWIAAFRQGSFIHKYWQYWLCFPIATIAAAFVASRKSQRPAMLLAAAACAGLVVYQLLAAKDSYAGIVKEQLGTTEDIAFLQTLREDTFTRFVFVPVSDTPLNQWFQGPLFEYYTDRAVVASSSNQSGLHAGEKVLVLRYRQRDSVIAAVSRWSGKTLANEKCGPRFCAYDVVEP